jgi:hypothetical protein
MSITTTHKKFVTVFMLMIVFVIMMKSFAIAKDMGVDHNMKFSHSICQTETEDFGKTAMDDFKPPKQSFVDYDIFFSSATLIPLNQPHDSLLAVHLCLLATPDSWQEILIPPKI